MPEQLFSYQQLFDFTRGILQKIGCPESDADTATKVLVSADLRGIDSHGVARLSGYVRLWEVNRVNTSPSVKVLHAGCKSAKRLCSHRAHRRRLSFKSQKPVRNQGRADVDFSWRDG